MHLRLEAQSNESNQGDDGIVVVNGVVVGHRHRPLVSTHTPFFRPIDTYNKYQLKTIVNYVTTLNY